MIYSSSEEKYLLVIYKQQGVAISNFVGTNDIADKLHVKPSSVTEMLNKLNAKELVNYIKSQGVALTELGRKSALKILRAQLLWECFLMDKIKFSSSETRSIAIELTHVITDEVVEKLSCYLGNPLYALNGEPIPTATGSMDHAFGSIMSSLDKGFVGKITAIKENDTAFLEYIKKRKISLGVKFKIVDICLFDQSIEVELLELGSSLTLSKKIADAIIVAK